MLKKSKQKFIKLGAQKNQRQLYKVIPTCMEKTLKVLFSDSFKLIFISGLKSNRDLGSKQEKWLVKITSDHYNLARVSNQK